MNILFMTIGRFESIESHSIYADLLRCFRNYGHEIYAISPHEKRTGKKPEIILEKGAHILHVEAGKVKGAGNLISKGLAQISLEPIFIKAIKKHFREVKFDLILYSTPPITFSNVVEYVKKRDQAKSYLLLKDIFPQNAVDLGLMSTRGPKSLIYKYFRNKEKKLYAVSEYIGCMSEANVQYLRRHNPEVDPEKVEVCPNAVEVIDRSVDAETRKRIRDKYGIPQDQTVFIYGGNLGKPQGIPFLIECMREVQAVKDAFFLIVGSGNEYRKIESFVEQEKPANMKLMGILPKDDYDSMVGACDVGLIFLDHQFTIPNFPSRLLAYMQAKLPVLAVTDPNTDIGKVIVDGGFGWWCESDDAVRFSECIRGILKENCPIYGSRGFSVLNEKYSVNKAYETILKRISK